MTKKTSKAEMIRRYLDLYPKATAHEIAAQYKVSTNYAYKLIKEYTPNVADPTKPDELKTMVKGLVQIAEEAEAEVVAVKKPSAANQRQVGGEHYVTLSVEPWDAMQAWMTKAEFMGFLKGNIIKYVARTKNPNDLDKAGHYMQKLLEVKDGLDNTGL
jgi:hypothetical protein